MKKSISILLIILVSVFIFLKITGIKSEGLYGLLISKEEKHFYQKLEEFERSPQDEIFIRDLTSFEWEDVCYVLPYGGIDDKFKDVKLNKGISEDDNDGKFAVVFIKNNSGKVFRISRSIFTLTENCSNRDQVLLKINKNESPKQVQQRLQKQYPIEWFYKKFGEKRSEDACEGGIYNDESKLLGYCIFSSENKNQNYDSLNKFTADEIKSVLVNYDYTGRMYMFTKTILEEIGKNPNDKKLQDIKKFVISKDYLMITNFGCDVFQYVPQDLPFYKEMAFKQIGRNGGDILKCLPDKFKDDDSFAIDIVSGYSELKLINDQGDGIDPIGNTDFFEPNAPCHYATANLVYLSDRLKDDDELVWFVVSRTGPYAIGFASTRLQEKFKNIWLPENKEKFDQYKKLYEAKYLEYQKCE